MIVLDENLDEQRVRVPLAGRYKGKIISVRDLRLGTVIKDDAVPALLCRERSPMFVTTNVIDFWRKVAAHRRYCIICVPLPNDRQDEIPDLIWRLLRHRSFRTIQRRMGKVIRASWLDIRYYESVGRAVTKVAWNYVRQNLR